MAGFPLLSGLISRTQDAWRRFQSLPWRWKGPALVAAALALLAVALTALAIASGGGNGRSAGKIGELTPGPTRPSTGEATPTPTTTPSATSTPTPAPPSEPPAGPAAGGYRLVRALPSATFDRMLGFELIPGTSEAVVVTQGGGVWRLSLGGGAASLYGDLSGRVIDFNAENEGGLLGLAFSPRFQSDRRVYLYFTSNDCAGGFARCDVLARYRVNGTIDAASEVVLLEVEDPYSNHNGGQLTFGPDGYLYLALGDGGSAGDPRGNGQSLSTLLGKILRLDVSGAGYTVPPDNPFAGRAGARPEIYAYGLRNPWRFSFDRASGRLWAADVGQFRWEEVDGIVAGGNYGWNIMEGFECFQAAGCNTEGLRVPRAVYGRDDGCSVTGGYVYRGPSMPELSGWYVYGDYCSGKVWAVDTADDSAPVLLADTGLPIASFGELPDGELLALTFANAVYRLERGS